MAEIEPFRAIRFSQTDLSDLVAPPYDVLNQADKDALLEKNEQNIVKIDLPHLPPKTAGPAEAYERSAGELVSWLDTHHLLHDSEPAIYVYHQSYRLGEQDLTRKMFFCRLRLEKFGEGCVFPHEQTFGGPKEDRLKLTIATRCNVSPIFGLYPDPGNRVCGTLDTALDLEPDARAVMDGVQNSLWVVTDPDTIADVRRLLADSPIFIADGHHRYSTAMNYREHMIEQLGEQPAADDPVNYVLTVLGGMEDPGATIRPYFRSIANLPQVDLQGLLKLLAADFDCQTGRRPTDAAELQTHLAGAGAGAFALYLAKEDACVTLVPKKADTLADLEPQRHASWRRQPYAVLHRLVIDELIRKQVNDGQAPTIHYHKGMQEAITDAHEHAGLAALMPATTMTELRDVCAAGELMPQKSTYFFPKLVTGMVINPLYDVGDAAL